MERISAIEAEGRLAELLERADAGEIIEITRPGRPTARLAVERSESSRAPRQPIDVDALRELTSRLPMQEDNFVRKMRDSDRY